MHLRSFLLILVAHLIAVVLVRAAARRADERLALRAVVVERLLCVQALA